MIDKPYYDAAVHDDRLIDGRNDPVTNSPLPHARTGKIVCFTGHREIPQTELARLLQLLDNTVEQQIQSGAALFRTGGAIGFDTYAALSVLKLRRKYPHVALELVLPCPTQTKGWSDNDTRLYRQILEQADRYRYLSTSYYNGVMQMRNLTLVEGADVCISYLRTSHGGGAAFTAATALRNGLELINLQDFL